MKLEKDAVTIVGFSIIFILILLIITPPVLRLMFGKEQENNNSNKRLTTTIQKLECEKNEKNEKYNLITNINTIYKGNSINKITFIYNVQFNETGLSAADIYISEFERLKQTSNASVTANVNSFVIELDYSKNDYQYDEFLNKYSKDISTQRLYYSNSGYTCNVVS